MFDEGVGFCTSQKINKLLIKLTIQMFGIGRKITQ
jgi:hypothetical protein